MSANLASMYAAPDALSAISATFLRDYNPRVPFSKNSRPPPRAAPSPFMPVSVALQTASMDVHTTRSGPSSGSRTGPLPSHVPVKPLDKNQQPTHVGSQFSPRPPTERHTSRLLPPTEVDQCPANPLSTPLISPPKIMVPTTTSSKSSTSASHIPSLPSLRYDPQKEPNFRTQVTIMSEEMNTKATVLSSNLSNTTPIPFSEPLMTSLPTPVPSVPRDQNRPQTQSTSSSNLDPPPTVGHGVKRRLGMGRSATGYANKKFRPHT